MTMLVRSATLRVFGVSAFASAASHSFAMFTLRAQYAGTSGSLPPMMPFDSPFGASKRCA